MPKTTTKWEPTDMSPNPAYVPRLLASIGVLEGSAKHMEGRIQWVREQQHKMVQDARACGATWEDIGNAVGLTRMGAYKRWSGDLIPTSDVLPVHVDDYGDPWDDVVSDDDIARLLAET